MACRISELVFECLDAEAQAAFWCEVLGHEVLERAGDGTVEIGPAVGFGGAQPTILFIPTDQPKQAKSRLHFDVNAWDRDQADELERLLALGARQVDIGQASDASWHVLADPEGNEFCLLSTQLDPLT